MSDILPFDKARHRRNPAAAKPLREPTRRPGASSPTLEARLAHLEGDLSEARRELAAVRAHLAHIKGMQAKMESRLHAVPTTWKSATLTLLAVAVILLALHFGYVHAS